MTDIKKPDPKKQPGGFTPAKVKHPERKPPKLDGFSERVQRQQKQVERDRFGRRKPSQEG